MIREALEFLFLEARSDKRAEPQVLSVGDRSRLIYVGGESTEVEIDKPVARFQAESIDGVIALVERFGSASTVFVNAEGITAILDDEDRAEIVDMCFAMSPQYLALVKDVAGGVSQRRLVRYLRTVLYEIVGTDDFLRVVKALDWSQQHTASGRVDPSRESMGRAVEKEVRSATEIPETVGACLPLFSVPSDQPSAINLRLAVVTDLDEETIALKPVGDCVERETRRVIDEIVSRIASVTPEHCLTVAGSVNLRRSNATI